MAKFQLLPKLVGADASTAWKTDSYEKETGGTIFELIPALYDCPNLIHARIDAHFLHAMLAGCFQVTA